MRHNMTLYTMQQTNIPASVGILTLNSAANLPRALESVAAFDDVYICDGNSVDGTQDVARSAGARVLKQVETDEPNQRITDFGATRTKCWEAAKFDWYFRLDSDEYLSPEAEEEIRGIVANPNPPYRAYKVPRKYVWRGNVIDDTITYPNRQPRFFHKSAMLGYTKITHEKPVLRNGEVYGLLKNVMYVPLPDDFVEFDATRAERAYDWDRRHYWAVMTPGHWLLAVKNTTLTLGLFALRLVRVRLISKGNKLPFKYELWRFRYLITTLGIATRIAFLKAIGKTSTFS